MKKIILSIAMLTAIIFTSCSSDNNDVDPCEEISQEQTETLFTNLFTSALNFGLNPTTENCNAYKSSAQEYIDYANEIKGCLDSTEQAELEEEIDDLETELADLNCN